jgi:hypothetical protein
MFSLIQQANCSSFIVPSATARITATQEASSVIKSSPFRFRKVSVTTRAVRLLPSTNGMIFSDPIAVGGGQPGEIAVLVWFIDCNVFGPVKGGTQQAVIPHSARSAMFGDLFFMDGKDGR